MHHAVMNENIALIEMLFKIDPEQCLIKNHEGKSPFHLGV